MKVFSVPTFETFSFIFGSVPLSVLSTMVNSSDALATLNLVLNKRILDLEVAPCNFKHGPPNQASSNVKSQLIGSAGIVVPSPLSIHQRHVGNKSCKPRLYHLCSNVTTPSLLNERPLPKLKRVTKGSSVKALSSITAFE